jgi:hypothetical protein
LPPPSGSTSKNLDVMKSNAKRILNQILNRTEEEREFLDRFLERVNTSQNCWLRADRPDY